MGYLHIDNLYKNQEILMFKECYALEKIHGTSAHIKYTKGTVTLFSGGEKHAKFAALFDLDALKVKFEEQGVFSATIYGEAYGGKCQGMSGTYGKQLKFVAFDVNIGDGDTQGAWLTVPDAHNFVEKFGLEFVDYEIIPTDLAAIDAQRDRPSTQAARNGIERDKEREGVVLRPLIDLRKNNGSRIISKHKNDAFKETKTPRSVDPAKMQILSDAKAIATEWVTHMRLMHVLQKLQNPDITQMRNIIKAMVDDIEREGKGEIIESREARAAIGKRTAELFKIYLNSLLREK